MSLAFVAAAVLLPGAARAADPLTPIEQQWALAGAPAVKIAVRRDGWYRVSRKRLLAAGLPAGAASRSLHLYADGKEVPIVVRPDRAIEFFGVRRYQTTTDTRTYWLVSKPDRGLRITRERRTTKRARAVASFGSTVLDRPRTVYIAPLKGGPPDNFFGPSITPGKTVSRTLSVPAPDARFGATLNIGLQGFSLKPHVVNISLNGEKVGTVSFQDRSPATAVSRLRAGVVKPGDNTVSFTTSGGELDIVVLWRIQVAYHRLYQTVGNRLFFKLARSRTAKLTGFTSRDVQVVDITRPTSPRFVRASIGRSGDGYAASIRATSRTRRLYAVARGAAMEPASVSAERPSQLHTAGQGADEIIISYADFIPSLGPLVQLRESQGLRVKVVDVQDVYDEFGYGVHGPDAIRSFLARAYLAWSPRPRFVLLFGDATYDPQNYLGQGMRDFVPSELVPTDTSTVPSDDLLADFNRDGVPELAVGRLAPQTVERADRVVAKTVSYETTARGAARDALFVSDNDPKINLEGAADALQGLIPGSMAVERRYRRDSASKDEFRQSLIADLNSGPSIVDYVGHGGPGVWGREGFFFPSDTPQLHNSTQLSLYLATTCLSGYFLDPVLDSVGESLIETAEGGAFAVFSSSGTETLESGSKLNSELLRGLFDPATPTIGEAAAAAKRRYGGGRDASVMILFGDPASRLR